MDLSEDLYNTIFILTGVFNLIILICFFALVYYVKELKKTVVNNPLNVNYYLDEYHKHRSIGKIENAETALNNAFWLETKSRHLCIFRV